MSISHGFIGGPKAATPAKRVSYAAPPALRSGTTGFEKRPLIPTQNRTALRLRAGG